eukprot:GILK01013702.1.p1 GENE.GILK01013702.1~~GILK01013702.1.p1  ORF type:complete len:112 (+),score=12.90 GILK01013702.1:404-739(+)
MDFEAPIDAAGGARNTRYTRGLQDPAAANSRQVSETEENNALFKSKVVQPEQLANDSPPPDTGIWNNYNMDMTDAKRKLEHKSDGSIETVHDTRTGSQRPAKGPLEGSFPL